jgi:hypothetical protein
MKKSIYNNIQVYNVWVNGRSIEDVDQHFPVNTNIDRNWNSNLKQAVKDYFNAKVNDCDSEDGFYSEIYQDYIVTLFSIDINIDEFEKKYQIKFDIDNEQVQELIPYYCDYNLNTVAERISKFKK